MTTARLTVRRIKDLRPTPGAQYVAWDTDVPGFGVRVSPAGAKTYLLKYRLKSGRVRWATLDRVGVLTLDGARDKARQYRGLVASGLDPLQQVDAAKGAPTLSSVADRFLDEYVSLKKPATVRLYRLAIDTYIRPLLGPVAIADVASDDVLRLQHRLQATPYMANRCHAVLSKLMAWSEQKRYRPIRSNPCLGVEKFTEHKRRRYLSPAELQRLGAAFRVAERREAISPSSLAIIKLLLLTGARVSEITTLRWKDVDLRGGVLNLPDSKTGAKTILLSAPAVEIFETWPRFAGPYVFPGEGRGKGKGKHRVSLTDAWGWLRRRAKVPDVRLHDLRHSFASVAVSHGQTLPMIGALLGHTQPATTARYAHLQTDPLRVASETTAATIATAIGRRPR